MRHSISEFLNNNEPANLVLQYNDLSKDIANLLDKADVEPSETMLNIHETLYREILEEVETVQHLIELDGLFCEKEIILDNWGVADWQGADIK